MADQGVGRGLGGRGALILQLLQARSRRPATEEGQPPPVEAAAAAASPPTSAGEASVAAAAAAAPDPGGLQLPSSLHRASPIGRGVRVSQLLAMRVKQSEEEARQAGQQQMPSPPTPAPAPSVPRVGRGVPQPGAQPPTSAPSPPAREMQQLSLQSPQTKVTEPQVTSGTDGKTILVTANYIPMRIVKGHGVFEYAVLFEPQIDNKRHRFRLVTQQAETLGSARVFDGAKLYLPIMLPQQTMTFTSEHPTDGTPVKVTVKLVAQQQLENCVQLYNVLFRRIMNYLNLTEVGRHHYDPKSAIRIPQHKLDIWPGFITSIRQYKGGVLLMADVSHRVLRTQTVLELMHELHQTQRQNFRDAILKKLVGCIVLTRYNNKTYRVDDMSFEHNPNSTFQMASGENVSYRDYYRKVYQLEIGDTEQPLLIHRAKKKAWRGESEQATQLICLVPELCYLTGLTDDIRSDFTVMKDVAAHTRVNPNERRASLCRFVANVNSNADARKLLTQWGIEFGSTTIEIEGRVVKPEKIFLKNESFLTNDSADWSRELGRDQVIKAVDLVNWVIVFTQRDNARTNDFVQMMTRVAPSLGMRVNQPRFSNVHDDRTDAFLSAIRESMNRQVQLVVMISPSSRTDRYSAVKKLCCCDMPVPSQVINARTIGQPQKLRSIVTKIALQINCKLGGELWAVEIPLRHLMVCGLDVYHDPTRAHCSVLGFVASMNPSCTRWFNHTFLQSKGQEIGDSLKMCLVLALRKYYEVNHTMPERIVIYRDGVSDGQMNVVSEHEVPQLASAFSSYGDYAPKLTVIVVQKRIFTRVMALMGGGGGGRGNCTNPPPGTVVDHTITRPNWYDFFLVSQHVRQGTVFPTHYVVVHDNSNFKPDHVQRLTYKLTHMYYNWPGTIRVPAVCLYAHRLAYLVGQNLHKEPSTDLSDRLFFL